MPVPSSIDQLLEEGVTAHRAEEFETATRRYRAILDENPNEPNALHLLGLLERRAGRFIEACTLLAKARDIRPDLPGMANNITNLHRAASAQAYDLFNARRFDEALSLLRALKDLDPSNEDIWLLLALCTLQNSLEEEAVDAFTHLLRLNPLHTEAWQNLGALLHRLGRKAEAYDAMRQASIARPDLLDLWRGIAIASRLSEKQYQEVLRHLHTRLRPRTYVEIGIFKGDTLALALPETRAFGVDPAPKLDEPPPSNTSVHAMTSDAFFADPALNDMLRRRRVDMAFIDGFHSFDQVLRDFMNLEPLMSPNGVILIHDCFPVDAASAERTTTPTARLWAGDVWKAIPCLKACRPDLRIHTLPVRPTGLAIVTGLNPHSTALGTHYERLVERYKALPFSFLCGRQETMLNEVATDWDTIEALLPEPS